MPEPPNLQDVLHALKWQAHCLKTHRSWIEYLSDNPPQHEHHEDVGSLEHHVNCVKEYEHSIQVLKSLLPQMDGSATDPSS